MIGSPFKKEMMMTLMNDDISTSGRGNSPKEIRPPEWKIENVVATVAMNIVDDTGKIDLNVVARRYPNVEYNPERFPGLVMRIDDPKATALVFSTGKMVITGLKSEDIVDPAVKKIIANLTKAKIKISPDMVTTVQNMVASGDLHGFVDLNEAAVIMDNAIYEPEVFPGLIHRMKEPKVVFLLFSTGRVVCTGAKSREIVGTAMKKLMGIMTSLDLVGSRNESGGADGFDFI
jgi:transcription initiation factor TFIID TATA-box-binding protein